MSKVMRGFRAELAAAASKIHEGKSTTPHSHALILVLDWLFYWSRPCTWLRAPAHLRSWMRVRIWFRVLAAILGRPRYPFDDARLNRGRSR